MTPDGLVIVDKPRDWTSHDVVGKLRRVYGTRKVGHAGTLDPMATGVLLVGIGRATRLLRFLQESGKRYLGAITFGVSTDTLDAQGTVIESRDVAVTRDDVLEVLPRFTGCIEQVPPMVSAIKIGGKKLYELARKGEEVERAPRPVTISRLDLVEFVDGAQPQATIDVECSSGTYIRSLAVDIGSAVGAPAHLSVLRRTRVGAYSIDDAVPLAAIEADPVAALRPVGDAVRSLPSVSLDPAGVTNVRHGRKVVWDGTGSGPHALFGPDGALVAVADVRGGQLCPSIVLAGD